MLKVKSVSFGDFPIYSFLDPIDWIDNFVAPFSFHGVDSPLELGIDYPYKQEAFLLQFLNRYLLDQVIT